MVEQSTSLTVTATQFAALSSPTIVRADSISTVGELSSLTVGFSLNLPVDANCKLRVIFPSDQPATVALDQTTASGTNLFASTKSLSAKDIPNNYIDVIGCSGFIEDIAANNPSTVTFGKIKNKGFVADTSQFKF
jgi:hypothetical protein